MPRRKKLREERSGKDLEECAKLQYNYWQKDEAQLMTSRTFTRKYQPVNAIVHAQPIEFFVAGSPHYYIDLSSSTIRVRARIVTPAGAVAGAGDHVSTCNLTINSMFGDILFELGGKLLNQNTNGLYPYRAYLETLLSINEETKEKFFPIECWYKDTPAQIGQVDPNAAAGDRNRGLFARMTRFGGNIVEMVFRPHLDLFHQELSIPPNVSLHLILHQARDAFVLKTDRLYGGGQTLYRMDIMECVFSVVTSEVFRSIEESHIGMLYSGNNIRIKYDKVEIKQLAIPAGQANHHFEGVFKGVLPERVFIALVEQQAKDGHYQQNPFNFQHNNQSHIALFINNVIHNGYAIEPDYRAASVSYADAYLTLYQAMGRDYKNQSVGIGFEEYNQGFTIYGFDLTPDGSADFCPNLPREGEIRLDFGFRVAPANPLTAVIYSQGCGELQIEANGEVIVVQ